MSFTSRAKYSKCFGWAYNEKTVVSNFVGLKNVSNPSLPPVVMLTKYGKQFKVKKK